jgi:UDP-N-acetylmuramoyl-tripeptide--D-alanyl-D-alanine ligase
MDSRPAEFTLEHLCRGLAVSERRLSLGPLGRLPIRNAVIDSRLASSGCLFIALRGENHDGHRFISEAVSKGSVAVLSEREPDIPCVLVRTTHGVTVSGSDVPGAPEGAEVALLEGTQVGDRRSSLPICFVVPDTLEALQRLAAYWRRQHDVRVIGITGSVGKTTSKEVIALVLGQRYLTLKTEGNYNNEIGLPLSLLHLRARHERVVLEMGMYDLGEIAQLAEIALPQVGVLTNVGPTHLQRLGTIERIAQAKAELPRALPAASEGGVAILNADDHWIMGMADQTRARILTYGLSSEADLWADDIQSEGLEGIYFRFHYGRDSIHARVPLLGRHSVHTALCAAAVGLVEGLAWEEIIQGLRDQSSQLRLVAVSGPDGSTILDDTYNASPASTIAALNLLQELRLDNNGGRTIAVLGDMYELGVYEEEGHKLVGRRARDVADILVTVGALGRTIGQEALKVGMPGSAVHMVETNAEAIDLVRSIIQPSTGGDKVLVKGSRGMAMEEIVVALQEEDPS